MAKFIPVKKYKYGFSSPETAVFKTQKGLNEAVIRQISAAKYETKDMLNFRLNSYRQFLAKPLPTWGPDLSKINFDDIYYYLKPSDREAQSWNSLPSDIKNTYDRLGIPQAEKDYLGGVKAQYESEVVYGSLISRLVRQGVIFCSMDEAVSKYPDLVWSHFSQIVPPDDNKFAALNGAVWSGGSFIYIPKGLKVDLPLQAYFRINSQNMGQFERTLIMVDRDAFVHYIEGCTAPKYSTDSLHAAVVEIYIAPGGRCRYTTIQNWSTNVYNLVTKRAYVESGGVMEWVDGNLGSKTTIKYPSTILAGPHAHGQVLSIAVAGPNQILDAGGKAIHLAPHTTSQVISKSISFGGGQSSYRGTVNITKKSRNSRSKVVCDALILDHRSRSDTYPVNKNFSPSSVLEHEATVSKIGDDQIFYLMSRGFSQSESEAMIINGFIEPIVKELPMEYGLELNRLINLQMEGSLG